MSLRLPWSRAQNVATIDVGTNSSLMLIAQVVESDRTYRILADEAEITQLGKGFYQERRLQPDAIARTLEALRIFKRFAEEYDVTEIVITGTSVLRDAPNGSEFTEAARALFGVEVEVLSGEEEARLSYLAVRRDPILAIPEGVMCVVTDVGGGSTELILGDERIRQMASLDVGSVRLTESFLHSDPPTSEEIEALQRHLDDIFLRAPEPVSVYALVGVAGTVANLANVAIHREGLSRDVHGFPLSVETLADEIALFRCKTTAERATIPGIEPKRAGVILAGALIVERVMRHYRQEMLLASVRGLRFGVFYDRFLDGAKGWQGVSE